MKDHMKNPSGQALLAPSDIAKLGDVSAAAVSNWRKRANDFPAPAGGTDARPLFARDQVIAWMKANNKPMVGRASADAVAAANLVGDMFGGSAQAEDGARLVVTLLAARKLSTESTHDYPLWQAFLARANEDGFEALRQLGIEYELDRWDELVALPGWVDQIPPRISASVAEIVDNIATTDAAEAADSVLNRAISTRGRAGSEHGYIGSRVSTFLARISAQDARGVVYDPACGLGDVLMQIHDLAPDDAIEWMEAHDINTEAVMLADQRAFLRDAPLALNNVDVLSKDPFVDYPADLIVAEPPLGMKYDRFDLMDPRWVYGTPSPGSSEFAWIQHAVAHLAEGGVAYVVTAGGPLFRGGRDGEIRRRLIADGCVEAIYQLPGKLLQHLSIPVVVWVLRRPGSAESIRFVNSATDTVLGGRKVFESTNPNAEVSIDDVLAGDCNLVPERWIGLDTPDPTEVVENYTASLEEVQAAARSVSTISELQPVKGIESSRVVSVRELQEAGIIAIRMGRERPAGPNETPDPRRLSGRDVVHRDIGPVENDQSDSSDVTVPGEVVVATTGRLAAVLDESGGHTLGMGLVGLRVLSPQLRPDYLAAVVDGNWNRRFFTGATIQRISAKELEIPLLSLEDQEEFVRSAAHLQQVRALAQELLNSTSEALEHLAELARYASVTPQ
ncbi:hypothetical protein BJ980_002284 [Nocardioides daedukensis]|uniref:site-specific DNA-methyltransferase (adenine-specific) n=1 Tax=Nocardioides daedukensis TaxID=634462 RepID=A0A7Y9RZ76_9ACTN|nr:N-6 DNA methylase [Nocardioides daedukensis]NYG59361.1 hypothetical protein [Nocardioides daedukensis]